MCERSLNGVCPRCGGTMFGDGYNVVLHCEFADDDGIECIAPDSEPIYCDFTEDECEDFKAYKSKLIKKIEPLLFFRVLISFILLSVGYKCFKYQYSFFFVINRLPRDFCLKVFCYHFSTGDKLISFTEETFCYHFLICSAPW